MATTRSTIWAVLTVAAAVSTAVYGADGTILIDQTHAQAGGITPGDTPGFPVTISQPGSYRLASNLKVENANTTAIFITTDNVTLDLNGFSILGPTVCTAFYGRVSSCAPAGTGTGIQSSSSNIAIINGEIRGMGADGVAMVGASNIRIDKIRAIGNRGVGIGIFVGPNGGVASDSVTSSFANTNGDRGIVATGKVTGNVAVGNGADGMDVGGLVSGNTASNNKGIGISAFGLISGNFASFNAGGGIQSECPSNVIGNAAYANGGSGDIFDVPMTTGCVKTNNLP